MRDSTNDISRALRERLADNGSWRVKDGKTPPRWKPDAIDLARPRAISRGRLLLGGVLVVLLSGGAWAVFAASTSQPTDPQVLESPAQNLVTTTPLPELWLTPVATPEPHPTVGPRPTTAPIAVERPPTPESVLHVPVPQALVAHTDAGAVTHMTAYLDTLTVDAQLTRPMAVGVDQQLEISAQSGNAPLVGAHVSVRVTNSFGSSVQAAPDTDRSGRSSTSWPTYRSVGLNQVRVLVSLGDGRELSAQLAYLGASSEG